MTNPYETSARLAKVAKLVRVFRAANFTVDHVAAMQPGDWLRVAKSAGVNPPSEKTQRAVIEELRKDEAMAPKIPQRDFPEESSFGPMQWEEMYDRRRR